MVGRRTGAIGAYVVVVSFLNQGVSAWVLLLASAIAVIHLVDFLITNAHCRAVNGIVVADDLLDHQKTQRERAPYLVTVGETECKRNWWTRILGRIC